MDFQRQNDKSLQETMDDLEGIRSAFTETTAHAEEQNRRMLNAVVFITKKTAEMDSRLAEMDSRLVGMENNFLKFGNQLIEIYNLIKKSNGHAC
jgi:hypothetical protein